MARSKTNRRQARGLNELKTRGIQAAALGVVFLVAPMFVGSSPLLKPITAALRTPGWLALGLGLVLLGLHQVMKTKTAKLAAVPVTPAPRREPTVDVQAFAPPAPEARRQPAAAPAPATAWSADVFAAIEWRRFEAVCETLFAQAGFTTRAQSHGADGGVDIWLHSANAQGPVAVVQCKHWQGKAVGVKELREFFGVMASNRLKRGTYATTSTFTPAAQVFAKDNGINAMDGTALLALIAKRKPEQQQALLDVAYQGEYWRPTCASCGIKLVERTPAKGGTAFWGCTNYPRCKSKLPMVAALR
jgi:restriction system protein